MSQLYQSFWGEIGAEVELRQVEQATHISEAIGGEYEPSASAWPRPRPAADAERRFLGGQLHHFTRFTDPSIEENLDALGATDDVEERKAIVEEISMTINENFPMTYHGSTLAVLGTQEAVKNLDGWTFPEGAEGSGISGATTMWGFVWTTE